MDIWTIPFIVVVVLIAWIAVKGVRKLEKAKLVPDGQDQDIPEMIEEHPFTLNPIVWVLGVAALFIAIVIFYYATSS